MRRLREEADRGGLAAGLLAVARHMCCPASRHAAATESASTKRAGRGELYRGK